MQDIGLGQVQKEWEGEARQGEARQGKARKWSSSRMFLLALLVCLCMTAFCGCRYPCECESVCGCEIVLSPLDAYLPTGRAFAAAGVADSADNDHNDDEDGVEQWCCW